MQSIDSLSEDLRRRIFTLILTIYVFGAAVATLFHYIDIQHSHLPDLIIPPLGIIISLYLLIRILKEPSSISLIIERVVFLSTLAMVIPEYYYITRTLIFPDERLMDLLPPFSSGPFLLTTVLIVFLRPRDSIRRALLIWLIIALPIVIYFAFRSEELFTPRGKDWFMSLVPMMAVNTCLVYYYSKMNEAVDQIQVERMRFKVASETDALTGAFNRRAGENLLQELISMPQTTVGVIIADIDFFKKINDTYGHASGDLVIKAFSTCLMNSLRLKDTLVRWGGEEFMIIVKDGTNQDIQFLAERLRHQVEQRHVEHVGGFTASFGVALSKENDSALSLFERADAALYRAKQNGRNRVEVAESLHR